MLYLSSSPAPVPHGPLSAVLRPGRLLEDPSPNRAINVGWRCCWMGHTPKNSLKAWGVAPPVPCLLVLLLVTQSSLSTFDLSISTDRPVCWLQIIVSVWVFKSPPSITQKSLTCQKLMGKLLHSSPRGAEPPGKINPRPTLPGTNQHFLRHSSASRCTLQLCAGYH